MRVSWRVQLIGGATVRYAGPQYDSYIRRRHRNGLLNGAFVDGSASVITEAEWNRVSRDERGYFYAIAAADR
jgi:prepilin-type processing-associated H-X9-DG protein